MMRTNAAGIALIKEFEGCSLKAYPDPATGGEPWTIGYGHTGNVRRGDTITQAQADSLLVDDLERFERAVNDLLGNAPATSNQFSALVSFCYNAGPGNLRKSSMLRFHRRGEYQAAADAFRLWNKAAGKVLRGLTRRREAERALYLRPDD